MEKKPKFLNINNEAIINITNLLSCRVFSTQTHDEYGNATDGFHVVIKCEGSDLEILLKTKPEVENFFNIITKIPSENIPMTLYSNKDCEIYLP